jgi:ribosomal protein L30E
MKIRDFFSKYSIFNFLTPKTKSLYKIDNKKFIKLFDKDFKSEVIYIENELKRQIETGRVLSTEEETKKVIEEYIYRLKDIARNIFKKHTSDIPWYEEDTDEYKSRIEYYIQIDDTFNTMLSFIRNKTVESFFKKYGGR